MTTKSKGKSKKAEREERTKQAVEKLTAARDIVSELADEVRESYDNMPENFQGGEKGEALSAAADTLDEALSAIEDQMNDLEAIEF